MANRYIRKTGSDSNGGTSPSDAWLTIGKALGASGAASGDVIYVGAGTYREAVTVAMTSPTAETKLVADTTGKFTGDKGEVIWTPYTTNDTTAPSGRCWTLAGRDYLSAFFFTMVGGNNTSALWVDGDTSHSTNIKLIACTFLPGGVLPNAGIRYTGLADTAANWEIAYCNFIAPGSSSSNGVILITLPTSASADYDVNFQIHNNGFVHSYTDACVYVTATGAGSFRGGGVDIEYCTSMGNGGMMRIGSANISTTIPCTVTRSICFARGTGLNANTSGQITEDYNYIQAGTARTNVSAGSNSTSDGSRAPLMDIGQAFVVGRPPRPYMTPMPGSPFLGFATAGTATLDLLQRQRPSGGASLNHAIGAMERHDFGTRETSVVDASGNGLVLTGPGDHEVLVPVDAESTTLSVRARFDSTHDTTNRPQAILLESEELGVATQTVTMTAAADTWETLTFSAFTPSAKGFVKLRFVSRPAAGGGKAFFDTVSGGADGGTQGMDYWALNDLVPVMAASGGGGGSSVLVGGGMRGGFRN